MLLFELKNLIQEYFTMNVLDTTVMHFVVRIVLIIVTSISSTNSYNNARTETKQ